MTEKQYSPSAKDKKISNKKMEMPKPKEVEQKITPKTEEVKEAPKKEVKEQPKKIEAKQFAIANGHSLRISQKYTSDVCRIIRGKSPEAAVARLELVLKGKRAVPMQNRETAHQKGKGIAGGKFPVEVCKAMIGLIKQAANNANVAGIENQVIFLANANRAGAPYKSGGRRAKRTHAYIEIRDKVKLLELTQGKLLARNR